MFRLMEELLAEIDAFLARHGMSGRDFGRQALGDHNFLRDLRGEGPMGKPRSPSLATADRVRVFMRDYVPASPEAEAA